LKTNQAFEYEHQLPIQLGKGEPAEAAAFKPGADLAELLKLEIIYFDLDKSFIRSDAEIELQKIIATLKQYPTMTIDVRSHTDCRSTVDYNMLLSEARARNTIKYLIKKGGIDASRLSGRGYGESTLVNNCKNEPDCSEEEHQLNRRSEFIILKR